MLLARTGVSTDVEVVRRGIMLTDREEFTGEKHGRKYLRGDEFLMVNPDKKPKKTKKVRETVVRRAAKSTTKKSRSKSTKRKSTRLAAASDESAYDDI